MKLAFISDIHGNVVALKSCLKLIKKMNVEKIYFLGDAIGYLPNGIEVIDILINNDVICIKGNHEAMLLGELTIKKENQNIYKLQSTKKQLSQKQLSAIANWGASYKFKVDGKSYLLTHGSPDDVLKGYIYPDSDLSIFNLFNEDVFIFGHTHYPFIKKFNDKVIINVGSIGLPRDVGNLSSFGIVDTKELHASIFRTKFKTKEILLNEVKNNIHSSVIKLINRRNDDYIGTLI